MSNSAGSDSLGDWHSDSEAFAQSLDADCIRAVASAAYRSLSPSLDASCTVEPCMGGSYNVVYEVRFLDGTAWVVRIPCPGSRTSFRTNVIGHLFVASHTSILIPKLHAYSLDDDNALGHPYMIMDFVLGIPLLDVWHDPSWWTGARSKSRTLASIARQILQLSSLEFEQIGVIERNDATGEYHVAPFPSRLDLCPRAMGPDGPLGPFKTQREYFEALRASEMVGLRSPELDFLGMFMGIYLDPKYDAGPFTLGHADLTCHNIFIDDVSGEVTAIIDWDNLAVLPPQLGAFAYPSWLVADWDPVSYEIYRGANQHDRVEDLHEYRSVYVDAVRAHSGDVAADITRNSHITAALNAALRQLHGMGDIVYQLGKLYCGSAKLIFDVCCAARSSIWYLRDPKEIIQMPGMSSNV